MREDNDTLKNNGLMNPGVEDQSNIDAQTTPDTFDIAEKIEAKVRALDAMPSVSEKDPLIGKTINNRFNILFRIGSGGMGVVYKGKQEGIDRFVAVKVLHKDLSGELKAAGRFKVEALAVSRLNHPNTIRIYDFGTTDDGIMYIAMEFLEGRELNKVLREKGVLPVKTALHITKQIASSLAEAHQKGVIHRDLKPGNIFLCKVGGDENFVKVLDFGLAKLRLSDSPEQNLTQSGVIFGTPRYMAPEQGSGVQVDHRCDLYSLGIITYEMLTGQTPFNADNPVAILIQHAQDPPPPFALVRPDIDVPEPVEAFVMRCLAKKPEQRFQSAEEIIAEIGKLEAILTGRHAHVVYVDKPRQVPKTYSSDSEFRTVPDTRDLMNKYYKGEKKRAPLSFYFVAAMFAGVILAFGTWFILFKTEKAEPVPVTLTSTIEKVDNIEKLSPKEVTEPPRRRHISLRFISNPPGADVILDNKILGKTPFVHEFEANGEEKRFIFRLNGHKDTTTTASLTMDQVINVAMIKAQPPPTKPTKTAPPVTMPSEPPKKQDGLGKVGDLKKGAY